MAPIKFFKFDELPKFQFTIKNELGDIFDLTGATSAKCYIRKEGATTNVFTGAAETATIISPTLGRIDYTLPSGGIPEEGNYTAQLVLIYSTGEQQTERFMFTVEAGLRSSAP